MAESKRFYACQARDPAALFRVEPDPHGEYLKAADVAEVLNKILAEANGHPDYVKVIHTTVETIADHLDIKL